MFPSPLRSLFTLTFALLVAGCAATTEQRIARADLAVGAAADGVRVGIQTGYLSDPKLKAAGLYGVNAANAAMVKVHEAHKAGDATGADFWLARVADFLSSVPTPTGADK
jgi:hypothetical protein